MSWHLTELESSLYLSWLLAKAHQVATPNLKLVWNPCRLDDDVGVVAAAQKMMQYIDQNLFPVWEIINEDADAVWDVLQNIPIAVKGYDIFDDNESFMECSEGSMWRMGLILVYLYEVSHDDIWAYYAYAELRNEWHVEQPIPPWAVADWLEANGNHPEVRKIENSLGLIYFLRYLCNSTGHQFLDYTPQMMGESNTQIPWTEEWIRDLTNQWREAQVIDKAIEAFLAWADEDASHMVQVGKVVGLAGAAVMATQDDKERWRLEKLEVAYAFLGGRSGDEVTRPDIAEVLENWEDLLSDEGDEFRFDDDVWGNDEEE